MYLTRICHFILLPIHELSGYSEKAQKASSLSLFTRWTCIVGLSKCYRFSPKHTLKLTVHLTCLTLNIAPRLSMHMNVMMQVVMVLHQPAEWCSISKQQTVCGFRFNMRSQTQHGTCPVESRLRPCLLTLSQTLHQQPLIPTLTPAFCLLCQFLAIQFANLLHRDVCMHRTV